jgi:uncharacterized protein YecT (DUF1311 family)
VRIMGRVALLIGFNGYSLRLALVCIATALPGLTRAEDSAGTTPTYSAGYDACMQRANGINADMHACIANESKAQDARLNKLYEQLRAELMAARRSALVAAQRDWIRFRDSNCAYRNDPQGGSNARLDAGLCLLRMTAERADELQTLRSPQ